ncbi:MAG TPA: 3-oxoacyl-ACP reductase FabG [Rhodanobacteraceae bacterium]|nr:3-oxoacyl-ACP reductase FabG [Rhodanobacteraceae bacterium]
MSASRRVLVTGASGGIGGAIAQALARDGFDLVLHFRRNADAAETLAEAIRADGGTAATLGFDISDREGARQALEADIEAHGAFWGAVLNAGISADNAFPGLSGDDWDRVVDTNLGGFYNVLHPLVMPLVRKRQGGRIVTIASVAGLIGNRGQTNYSAAKAGLIGATKALAVELASRRITVNCVAPGLIETGMIEDAPVEEILKHIPLARAGKPEEVAALVAFLFSDDGAYITRQVLSVNGGLC